MPTRPDAQISVPSIRLDAGEGQERLRSLEWLLTNGLSGFAMGTASGVPSRRYHGILVSDTTTSPERRVYVNALEEELVVTDKSGTQVVPLSCFRFRASDGSDVLHPEGWKAFRSFEKDVTCSWEFEALGANVTRRLALRRDARAAVVDYYVVPAKGTKVELRVRPMVSMRPFHTLQRRDHSSRQFEVDASTNGCRVRRADGMARLTITTSAAFEHEEQWWYNFVCSVDRARGQDCIEDLFSPGELVFTPSGKTHEIVGVVQFSLEDNLPLISVDKQVASPQIKRQRALIKAVQSSSAQSSEETQEAIAQLACATDDFVFSRTSGKDDRPVSIIAGYPWFNDWGRDSMIALPGLLLLTGRHEEALGVLKRFAGARRNGIVPNRFGDEHGEPLYNTVDASLWFVVACARYAEATGDHAGVQKELLPACLDVINHYRRGTEHAIGMDPRDFLITAGSPMTQLTWMDAFRDGVAFTPRHGKAVEINALWVCALAQVAEMTAKTDAVCSADLRALADAAGASFRTRFWNAERGCCFDTLAPEGGAWRGVAEVRPNQIFAVSLPHSPLTSSQAKSVLDVVRDRLYTPMGLRTLEQGHPAYRPRFRGGLNELDAAYHNGTVWPWLLGAFAEGVMRVDEFSAASRRAAQAALEPMLGFLDGWCVGQLPEVFDAEGTPEEPQRPGGCPAQAWSVAEVLRAWVMAEGAA